MSLICLDRQLTRASKIGSLLDDADNSKPDYVFEMTLGART
jgi:hypothetical protein